MIFGASGDLTARKLFPALYSLAYRRLLPQSFGIVGVARSERDATLAHGDEEGRPGARARRVPRGRLGELAAGMRYVATDFADDEGEDGLIAALEQLDEERARAATASSTSPCRRPPSR